jgi:tetratricopeptide (TPR) repeat protein
MKKAILIFSVLLSAVLIWYFYTIDDVRSKAIAHEEIGDYQRALEYYRENAELTNNNTTYAKKLYEIANKQIDDKDYYNAEMNLKKYKNISLSGRWIFSSLDSSIIYSYNIRLESLPYKFAKIYENSGRLEKALDYYLSNKNALVTRACLNCQVEDVCDYYNKAFNLSFKLNKLDTAFNVYLNQIYSMATIYDVEAIEEVINNKISRYNNSQKDSILKAIYDSYEVSISQFKDHNSYKTSIELFGRRIPDSEEPRPSPLLDSGISITDTTYMINQDWERFKNTSLYKLLAERPDKE